jgi:phenylacetic acid degradation operon negative regulatory protein
MNGTLHTFFRSLDESPLRTWSLIVTIYGDCVMPRGSELWLGSLTEILAALDVEPGSVRTAMSRLARDGFLIRRRVGRTSHYALSHDAIAVSRQAEARIYRATPPNAPADWDIAVAPGAAEADRRAMAALGYEALCPGVFVRPRLPAAEAPPGDMIRLAARGDDGALARAVYPLEEFAARYARFADAAQPLAAIGAAAKGLEAVALRVGLVHAFRRIVLRDPRLPCTALPADWPAAQAYEAFAVAYRTLEAASDAWLSANARNSAGRLPAPNKGCRFQDTADGPPDENV